MKKEIIINATSDEIRVALIEDNRLAEIFLEVPDKERHVGSIYLGRVERVVQGMNAAFVDIGEQQDAFLHFSDVGTALDEFRDFLDERDEEEETDAPSPAPRAKAAKTPAPRKEVAAPLPHTPTEKQSTKTPRREPAKGRKKEEGEAPPADDQPTQATETARARKAPPSRKSRAAETSETPAEKTAGREKASAARPTRAKKGTSRSKEAPPDIVEDSAVASPEQIPEEATHEGSTDGSEEDRKRKRRRGRRGGRRRRKEGHDPLEAGANDRGREEQPRQTRDVDEGHAIATSPALATSDEEASEARKKRRRRGRRGRGRGHEGEGTQREGFAAGDDTSSTPPLPVRDDVAPRETKGKGSGRTTKRRKEPETVGPSPVPSAPADDRSVKKSPEAEPKKPKATRKKTPEAKNPAELKNATEPVKKARKAGVTKKGSPTQGETPEETKKPKRPSARKKGGTTMDARLPTFQTKRSGEVTIGLEKGQDLIVQVTRESYASKGVRVSTKVSLPGRFLVLLPLDPAIGISRKVQNMKERRRLRRIARSILPEGHGCIIRTNAEDKDEELIRQDLQKLIDIWSEIEQKIRTAEPPMALYKDQSVANTVMRDMFTPDINRVVIDNKKLYNEIREYVDWAAPNLAGKIELHQGPTPVFEQFGVDDELQKMFERKIYIPAGGYIIMDQTEAMMVIDVNSGRYAGKKDQELNSLRTNLESAREIARQIRLRDIGGLLVVDFIDLYDEKNRKKVYDELKRELRRDRAKSVVLPMTQFGLVQMTRQRIRQQIVQTMSEPCSWCGGTGMVQSKSTVIRNIERWLTRFREASKEFRLTLAAHPLLIDFLTEGSPSRLTQIMLRHFVRIKVVPDESLPMEQFQFHSTRRGIDITAQYMPGRKK